MESVRSPAMRVSSYRADDRLLNETGPAGRGFSSAVETMGMIVAAHQPHFWPWLGYLDKWQCADVLVVLDDVDFPRQDFVHRNRILVAGHEHWLTLPVEKIPRGTAILAMRVAAGQDWRSTPGNAPPRLSPRPPISGNGPDRGFIPLRSTRLARLVPGVHGLAPAGPACIGGRLRCCSPAPWAFPPP